MYDPFAEFTKHVLPNGLEVHHAYWDRPWVHVEIVVHSGGREDPVGKPGIAHFVEHLVSSNVANMEAQDIIDFFESSGGRVKLGTSYYMGTRYSFSVPAEPLIFREALAIIGSMLFKSKIERQIERERNVILREFNDKYPISVILEADMAIRKELFKGHRLETYNRPIGFPSGIMSATKEDFQSFVDRYYVPANTSIVLVGGFSAKDILAELKNSPFGIHKKGDRNKIPDIYTVNPPKQRGTTIKFSDFITIKVDQAEYKSTWAFPVSFPKAARAVFDMMLRQILFTEIRQKNAFAYGTGTQGFDAQDIYEFGVLAKVNPASIDLISDMVEKCIASVKDRQDLFKKKKNLIMRRLSMSDYSGSDLADTLSSSLLIYQRNSSISEDLSDFQNVTFDQMVEASKLLSPDRNYELITRP